MLLSKVVKRCVTRRNVGIKTIVAFFQQRNNCSSNQNILRSKLPDVEIPNVFVEDIIFKGLNKWGDKIALECASTGRSYSYIQIYKKSRALANFLHKFSILKQNDTIATILPNIPEYPIIMLGAAQAGLRITTVNPLYTAGEIAKQLKDSNTKVIFTLGELWPKVDQAIRSLPNQAFTTITVNHTQKHTPSGTMNFEDVVDGDDNLSFKIKRSHDDVLLLPYSSGTTGLPKGVEITNRNVTAILTQVAVPEFSYLINENDVVPALLPMFHIYGLVAVMLNLMSRGCKLVTMSKFNPQLFIDVLEKHRPTISLLVPPLVLLLINHPGITQKHINQFKVIFSGAAPLGATDIERLQEKGKSDVSVLQGYGLTESCAGVCTQTKKIPEGVKIGGSGILLPNTELQVVSLNDQNKLLGPNESGELIVHGPQMMKGYLNNVKETQEALYSEGWFKTGDIGYYDEDGHIFITDRLKELIKVRGLQVAPAELEEILRDLPNVEDAAVAGVPHEMFGEVPKAFIIPKKGVKIDPDKIREYVDSKVSKHKHLLGGVVIVDSIPKTASGKILRRNLREL